MEFQPPLIKAIIKKRYKRFLSDIELNEEIVCAHVPNTGSMTTCWDKDWEVYLSESTNPKRKLKYTLELTNNGQTLIGVNTSLTNKIVLEALEDKVIRELPSYDHIKPEVKILDSRLDFKLEDKSSTTYLEVKNVTLKGEDDVALFPDAVSTRGQKHLEDLIKIKQLGHNAAMLYVVNRMDVESFAPAYKIDPKYSELLTRAQKEGVQILAYQCRITPSEIYLDKAIPVCI